MKRLIAFLFLLSVSASAAAAQDLDKAIKTYWQGDYAAALEQFLPFAEQGNAVAQFYVGQLYGLDENEPFFDQVASLKWFKSSANLGFGDAQFVVGRWYFFGAGVPKDNVLAYMWLNLSSGSQMWLSAIPANEFKLSGENAASLRDFIAEEMSPAAIEEAQRRTREWLDSHSQ